MFLNPYFSSNNHQFQFTRQQASHFAKKVAGDFNPIHDEDNRRFCVPGDLLFAVLLKKEGISQNMKFKFSGMVGEETPLHIENTQGQESAVVDENGKEYLHMSRDGEVSHNDAFIEHFVTSYARFSGMNFPHLLVPLMKDKNVMINCDRPLIMYESMEATFTHLDLTHPTVELSHTTFDVDGKRGLVTLHFNFINHDQIVGQGTKRLVVSGLRPYDDNAIDNLVARFHELKNAFQARIAGQAA
ncbi:hypothetical protein VR7878_01917 [Vibrio ruber DSM 16370]|uniref:DUF3581 domain-containing protein n=1 Tax=Vibrio ruber (strain DSM 16370 / JCM 11486 / BCRC 17186 / CECT 7878 / LMG 23124 / VR1) TaxID=1123498 RepID=A0A1R4LJN4_VIBR1|nr:DUF3581 domain-containing protein [Vibrio ruber]SJN56708.1 hypothetical protein VR7878_01917 [Vibrio ruber DSM 16370]